jgi:hypothetical protein
MKYPPKKIIKIAALSIVFLLIIIFVFFNSRALVSGVKIKNVNIKDNMKVSENILKITGTAKNAVKLTLDGREISVNEKGDFEETIVLLSGYNLIDIEAQDKFGNSDEKNYKLIYEAGITPAQ